MTGKLIECRHTRVGVTRLAVLLQEAGFAGERFDLPIMLQPEVTTRNAAFRGDGSDLDHDHPEATQGEEPQVNKMMVARHPFCCHVLAHRGRSSGS
jgi:hypothetical protein